MQGQMPWHTVVFDYVFSGCVVMEGGRSVSHSVMCRRQHRKGSSQGKEQDDDNNHDRQQGNDCNDLPPVCIKSQSDTIGNNELKILDHL